MRFPYLSLLIIILLGLSACKSNKMTEDQLTQFFYQSISDGDFDKALQWLDSMALDYNSKDEWMGLLNGNRERLGKCRKWEYLEKKTMEYEGEAGKGIYSRYILKVTYEKGIQYEKIFWFKKTGSAQPKMLAYLYNDNGNFIPITLDFE